MAPGRAEAGGTEELCTGPGKAVQKSSKGYAAEARPDVSSSRAVSPGGLSSEEEVKLELRSPGEQSGSEEEAGPPTGSVRSEDNGWSADGSIPVQPGELPLSIPIVGVSGSVGVGGSLGGTDISAGVVTTTGGLLGYWVFWRV